jgi:hypothetical protein
MPDIAYRYEISGAGANDQTWTVRGRLFFPPGAITDAMNRAMLETFQALTQGRAVYGSPGNGGCRGPYRMQRFLIEIVSDDL